MFGKEHRQVHGIRAFTRRQSEPRSLAAANDKTTVMAGIARTNHVIAETVADHQHPAWHVVERGYRCFECIGAGFAIPQDFSTTFRVKVGDGAKLGAVAFAPERSPIRVRADQRQIALHRFAQNLAVGSEILTVELGITDQDKVGLAGLFDTTEPQAIKQCGVFFHPYKQKVRATAFRQVACQAVTTNLTRGDQRVIVIRRQAHRQQPVDLDKTMAVRVGKQADRSDATQALQAIASTGQQFEPIMQGAPEVDEKPVIIAGDLGQSEVPRLSQKSRVLMPEQIL